MTNPGPCPFCNAQLPALAAAPTVDRLPCPRCGELVPAARWPVEPTAQTIRAGEPPMPGSPLAPREDGAVLSRSERATGRASNRKTAYILLGIMALMALVSLSYILWTANLRRSRHPFLFEKNDVIARRRPLELAGLGYLPKDASFIAGLHVAEMIDEKSPLLDEPRPALLDWLLKQMPRAAGLELKNIDHVLAAATLDGPLPQIVLVIKTRAPYDLESLSKSTKPARPPLYQEKALYEYPVNPFGVGYVWCVEERTLLCVIRIDDVTEEHLSGLTVKARPVEKVLPAAVHAMMKERLRPRQDLWVVGQVEKLGNLKAMLPVNNAAFNEMKAFAIGIEPLEGLTFMGHFQLSDAKAAAQFKTTLEGVPIDGAKSQKAEATPIDAPEHWVTWQVRGDIEAIREMLKRGKKK